MKLDTGQPFEIREELAAPTGLTLRLCGRFDDSRAEQFEDALGWSRDRFRELVIDLSGVTFMDSTAIRLVVEAKKCADRDGFELFVAIPNNGQVRKTFEMTGPTDFFTPNGH